MSRNTEQEARNKAFVLEAFEALFNRRDYAAAEKYWSPDYIQHSAHIPPGREGLSRSSGPASTMRLRERPDGCRWRLRDPPRALFRHRPAPPLGSSSTSYDSKAVVSPSTGTSSRTKATEEQSRADTRCSEAAFPPERSLRQRARPHDSTRPIMPMIDVYAPARSVPCGTDRTLAEELTARCLRAEGVTFRRRCTSTHGGLRAPTPHDGGPYGADRICAHRTRPGTHAARRLEPGGPEAPRRGGDRDRRKDLRRSFAIPRARGCFLTEAAEGGWGIAGTAFGRAEFAALAKKGGLIGRGTLPIARRDENEKHVDADLHRSSRARHLRWLIQCLSGPTHPSINDQVPGFSIASLSAISR